MKWSILRQSPFWQGLDKVESWHGGGVLIVVVGGNVAVVIGEGGGGDDGLCVCLLKGRG